MDRLKVYGWNEKLSRQKQTSGFKDLPHGRVSVTHKTCYEVTAENGVYLCELTGNILYGKTAEEYPCTGDWVIFLPTDRDRGVITDILPRRKTLNRKGKTHLHPAGNGHTGEFRSIDRHSGSQGIRHYFR